MDEKENVEALLTDIRKFDRRHCILGEEIVPLEIDLMVVSLDMTNKLSLFGTNQQFSEEENHCASKRQLCRNNYPSLFTIKTLRLDLRIDDSNGIRTARILQRFKLEIRAGLYLHVDTNCLEPLKEVFKWLVENGLCVVSFQFHMFCSFRSCRKILSKMLKEMPNLEYFSLLPTLGNMLKPGLEMPFISFDDRRAFAPKLKHLAIEQEYLTNRSFLYLLGTLDRSCLETCGFGTNLSNVTTDIKKFYHRHFQFDFVGVKCNFDFVIENLHHLSFKQSLKSYLKLGFFSNNTGYRYFCDTVRKTNVSGYANSTTEGSDLSDSDISDDSNLSDEHFSTPTSSNTSDELNLTNQNFSFSSDSDILDY